MSRRQSAPLVPPSSSTAPHSYESFSDLVPSSPSSSRRGIFSSGGAQPNRKWRSSTGSASAEGVGDWRLEGGARRDGDVEDYEDEEEVNDVETTADGGDEKDHLSTPNLIGLTIGLAGAQLAWTVEMAFGTPYLLSLGLTKQSTSLVWLAGPLSGLIVQPLVGALSDSSSSKYRRRFFILGSAICVIVSTLVVAYAHGIAAFTRSLSGLGDWDPSEEAGIKSLAIAIAVVGFYVLDFSLNGLQASLRALILDRSPSTQQNVANAWHGRMTHIANIFGYLAGYLNLGEWSGISWVGGGQFRKLAVISCAVMIVCVSITCYTQEEVAGVQEEGSKGVSWSKAINNVKESIKDLPLPVRRVCYVQFFAWTAYFPFLFYSTTYVAEVLFASIPEGTPPPSADTATRAGSLALLLFAIVAFISGSFLPWLSTLGRQPMIVNLSKTSPLGRWTRRALSVLTPRNFWTAGLAMYAVCIFGTFWVESVQGAMVVIAFLGVPWAVNCWVPFALVMESIRDLETTHLPSLPPTPIEPLTPTKLHLSQPFRASLRQGSLPRIRPVERTPLLSTPSSPSSPTSPSPVSTTPERKIAGGTILGIHNLAIVAPQFFVAIIAALIFKSIQLSRDSQGPIPGGDDEDGLRGSNDVVWVLRFGGLAAVGGAVMSRWVLRTRSESSYVRFLQSSVEPDEEQVDKRPTTP